MLNFILFLLLTFIIILIIFINVRISKKEKETDMYKVINSYKITNIYYTLFGISVYIFFNFFLFLILRMFFLTPSTTHNLLTFPINLLSLTIILQTLLVLVIFILILQIINLLFSKELRKFHFFLLGNSYYKELITAINDAKYRSFIIDFLTQKLDKFRVITCLTYKSVDEYHNFKKQINEDYYISEISKNIQKFFRKLYFNSKIYKYLIDFFFEQIVHFIEYKFPKWITVFPEVFLILFFFYDIYYHYLFYFTGYYLIFYIIFINLRKIKNFYVEINVANDDDIYLYLYEGIDFTDGNPMSYSYLIMKEYIIDTQFIDFLMMDYPKRGPWHEMLIKQNIAEKFILLLFIPFIIFSFQDSYEIQLKYLNISIPFYIYLFPLLLTKYVFKEKIFFFEDNPNNFMDLESQHAYYSRKWYLILWSLIITQYFFYCFIFLKNSFLFSASDTIFQGFGIVIIQNLSTYEKTQFFLDYYHLILQNTNLLHNHLNQKEILEKIIITDSSTLASIRILANTLFESFLISYRKIDSGILSPQDTKEIWILLRNSLLSIGLITFVAKEYNLIRCIYKIISQPQGVMYEVIKILFK